jgi:hypothetical protein
MLADQYELEAFLDQSLASRATISTQVSSAAAMQLFKASGSAISRKINGV